MTSRGARIVVLWMVFAAEAFTISIVAAWGSAVMDVALMVAFILGMPLSLIVAAAAGRKPLMLSIALGTLLIVCGTAVTLLVFEGNPLVLGGLVLLSAGVLWLCLPNAPDDHEDAACRVCGYPLEGLPGSRCPECGNAAAPCPECGAAASIEED